LIFIDETGLNTKMARLRRRSRSGERLFASILHGHWRTTTFVASLRLDGLNAPMVIDGPMNDEAFLAYVEQVLVLTLGPREIVVMDNLSQEHCRPLRERGSRRGTRDALWDAAGKIIDRFTSGQSRQSSTRGAC
jgi:hypothetical protein